jgi:hypothetical protein
MLENRCSNAFGPAIQTAWAFIAASGYRPTFEDEFDHTVEAQTLSTPVDIGIKRAEDPVSMLYEASIEIRIQSGPLRQQSGLEDPFELWSRTLNAKDREICSTLCREVLREYGGRIWIERTAKQEAIVSLTLPLAT